MYITVEELERIAKGFQEEEYILAITQAQDEIEAYTQNFFEPRKVALSYPDVKGERISLPFPIWKLDVLRLDDYPISPSAASLDPFSKPPSILLPYFARNESLYLEGVGGTFKPGPNFPSDLEDYEVFPIVRFCTLILASIQLGNPFENALLLETAIRAEETDGHRIEYFQGPSYIKNPKEFVRRSLFPFKAYIGGLTL